MVMKMRKFKEFRMFIVCLVMFMVFVGVSVFSALQGYKAQMIGAIMLTLIALYLLVLSYKMVLFEDVMMIYEWKVLAMLPTMIEYKDIQSIEKKSSHHLIIHHKHESHIYVFDSEQFIQAYESMKQEMNNEKK